MDDHSNANVLGRTMADLTQGFLTAALRTWFSSPSRLGSR